MTNETELLPCPFCGHDVTGWDRKYVQGRHDAAYIISCTGCELNYSSSDGSKKDAVFFWNTRTTKQPDAEAVARAIATVEIPLKACACIGKVNNEPVCNCKMIAARIRAKAAIAAMSLGEASKEGAGVETSADAALQPSPATDLWAVVEEALKTASDITSPSGWFWDEMKQALTAFQQIKEVVERVEARLEDIKSNESARLGENIGWKQGLQFSCLSAACVSLTALQQLKEKRG